MRLRELLRGSSPYKWSLESLDNGLWTEEASSGLLFYNYCGQRSERIYQNKILEIRSAEKHDSANYSERGSSH
jgi:hypothetical protein